MISISLKTYTHLNILPLGDTDTIKAYKENGLFVYAAVVNDISYFDKLRDIGVDGIVSDFIYEDMIDAK